MGQTKKAIERVQTYKFQLIAEGALVGVITGAVVSVFRLLLSKMDPLRTQVIEMAKGDVKGLFLALALLAVCFIGSVLCLKAAPYCGGSGIPQVKGELRGLLSVKWLSTIVAKIVGGCLSIGAGLSLGREGPSIQIGAMVGKGLARGMHRVNTEEKMLLSCGAGAGLASAFSAPLAGVMFTLEELHRNFSTDILLTTMSASIMADFVASRIFGLAPVFDLSMPQALPLGLYLWLIPFSLLLGILGVAYNKCTALFQDLFDKIPGKAGRLAVPFALIIPLAAFYPQVLGSGHQLVEQVARGDFLLGALAVLLLMKFFFSITSFSSGAPGGIFLPLLVLGAVTGGLYCQAVGLVSAKVSFYIANFVIYGMVGLFAAIVRAPVTGVILITEMSGNFTNFLALSIVALLAYITADVLRGEPIYDQLLARMTEKATGQSMPRKDRHKQILIESDVYMGSAMDGRSLAELGLPKGSLVVSIQRGRQRVVPHGETVLKGGDVLTVISRQEDLDAVQRRLDIMCRTLRG